jgi:hypothetical protein
VTGRSSSLVVEWTPPTIDGGDALTGYRLVATAGSLSQSTAAPPTAGEATIDGLENGTTYSLSLSARSKAGTSAAAQSSGTPAAPYAPGQPGGFQVAADGSGGLSVTWTAPVDDGGDTVIRYVVADQQEVAGSDGSWTTTGPVTRTDVPADTTTARLADVQAEGFYSVSVSAVSDAGTGTAVTTETPVSPTTKLAPGAVALTTATMNALRSDNSGTLVWDAPVPAQVSSVSAGKVLVGTVSAAAPNGLLVKVMSTSRATNGDVTMRTVAAQLSDAVSDYSLSQTNLFSSRAAPKFIPESPGVRLEPASSGSNPSYSLAVNLSLGDDSFSGSLTLEPSFSADFQIDQGVLDVPDGLGMGVSASVTGILAGSLSISKSVKWKITTITLPDIPLPGLPIVLEPEIPIVLTLSGAASLSISATMTVGASGSWNSSHPLTLNTKNLSRGPQLVAGPLPGLGVSDSVTATLAMEPEVEIDGVTGPEIQAGLALKVQLNFDPPPGKPFLQVTPSIVLKVGWDVDLALGPIQYADHLLVTLATLSFSGFTIEAPPAAHLTITPSNPVVKPGTSLQLKATSSDKSSHSPVTWTLMGAVSGDSISKAGLLKVVKPAGRTLRILGLDGSGASGAIIVDVAGAGDPPADLGSDLDTKGTGVTLSWRRPSSTGDAPLSSYTVVTDPPTRTLTLGPSATGTEVQGLSFGETYDVSVYDSNTAGLTSSPASVLVATPSRGAIASAASSKARLPSDAAAFPDVLLPATACMKNGTCIAVGSYDVTSGGQHGQRALIETISNGSETPLAAPVPSNALKDSSYLDAVSCPGATTCVATGSYQDTSTHTEHLVETLENGRWKPGELPFAKGAVPVLGAFFDDALSCPKSEACVDLTFECVTAGLTHPGLLVETEVNGAWTAAAASIPYRKDVGCLQNDTLYDLSCPTTRFCVTTGNAAFGQNFLDVFAAKRWTVSAPLAPPSMTDPSIGSIACGAAGSCVAVGQSSSASDTGEVVPLVDSYAGGSWTASNPPVPSNVDAYGEIGWLNAVDCPTAANCYAFGEYIAGSQYQGLVESLVGGTWSPAEAAVPDPGEGEFQAFEATCLGLGSCVAVSVGYNGEPFIVALAGTTVETISSSLPSGSSTSAQQANFGSVACSSAGTCLAAGSYEDSAEDLEGLIQTLGIAGA